MLNDKRLFLFDIDGTIAVGNDLFNGSRELLDYINSIGGTSIYITNNSTKNLEDYVNKFKKWNINTTVDQFITSGYITILYLKQYFADKKIFVLGTKSFIKDLTQEGLIITENVEPDISCVVVAFDNELNYSKLEKICEILSTKDIPYIATNPDLCCPAPFGFIPDCGSICQMIENSVDKKPLYLGKPSKNVVSKCLELTSFTKNETLVVGDRLYTDIACGLNSDVDTCLLLTGEATLNDLKDTEFKPNYIFKDVIELLNNCKKMNNY